MWALWGPEAMVHGPIGQGPWARPADLVLFARSIGYVFEGLRVDPWVLGTFQSVLFRIRPGVGVRFGSLMTSVWFVFSGLVRVLRFMFGSCSVRVRFMFGSRSA